jgi:hypothetical protein
MLFYAPSAMGTSVHHHHLVIETATPSSESYYILFSTFLRYSGGKFKHTYTELFFRKVAYTRYDVPWFKERMHFMHNNFIRWNIYFYYIFDLRKLKQFLSRREFIPTRKTVMIMIILVYDAVHYAGLLLKFGKNALLSSSRFPGNTMPHSRRNQCS